MPLPSAAEDLGTLPRVAEPPVSVAPLVVIRAPEGQGIFLYPNVPVVGGRTMPEGGFLPSSPLLLPASEGERWMPAEFLEGTFPFSEALASSVLPVKWHEHSLSQIRETSSVFTGFIYSHPSLKTQSLLRLLPGVLSAVVVPLALGGVIPTWAVMPLLHEPVWDIWANAAAF